MSSQPTFRGGGGRGGGGRPRGRGGRGGQFRGNSRERRSERPLSPDRRSVHSEEQFRPPRFSNYREPRRPNSRSPSPLNRMQHRNSPHEFSDRSDAEEEVRRAEYALRRAKMDHEAIKEAYQEYTETTIVRKN
ncbi:hypothetical protein CAEBREN_00014 [Caenorhabditis brenneri]|uniref:Uncharacterized protein n=1 Tax=Caenorhabditis brenneri TaxID=135651 RepID=G0P8M4_CAEBE|nr:hypothetical protein CAEBREN_00014 [Caenorhabditis brenneri]